MKSPPVYVSNREIKLKIKILNQDGQILQKGKIGVDRDTINYEKLCEQLTRTFHLKSPSFLMMYHVPNSSSGEGTLAMVDDWDLDAALQQFRHSMKITIQTSEGITQTDCSLNSWDVAVQDTTPTPAASGAQPTVTSPKQQSGRRRSSIFDKVIDKLQEIVFQREVIAEEEDSRPKKSAMTLKEFQHYLDADGRMVNYEAFRESIYYGGVEPALRKVVWRHLLCVFPKDLTGKQREQYLQKRSEEYKTLRDQWKTEYINSEGFLTEEMRFVTSMAKRDVIRADRSHPYFRGRQENKHTLMLFDLLCTYALNHPDVSYCQGMCDIASPLLMTQDNEAHAYLLFCAVMERMKHNFSHDGEAMSAKFAHLTQLLAHFDPEFHAYMQENQVDDLLFAYRWLLLEMKREFPLEDSLYFTEVMWSTLPTMLSDRDIPFAESKSADNQSHSSPAKFTHLASELESTLESTTSCSTSIAGDTVARDLAECDTVPVSDSLEKRSEFLDQALADGEHASDDDISDTQSENIDGVVSHSTCHCEEETSSRRSSIFYVDLDWNEVEPVKEPLRCTNSTDSGFQSRPESPVSKISDQLLAQLDAFEDSMEDNSSPFPPPKEFGFGNPFVLFGALAMLLQQRDKIMDEQMDFNDIVMLFNDFKCQHNVHKVLKEARQLYEAYVNNELKTNVDEFIHINVWSA